MFSFVDVPMFSMVLMPKGKRTIHGMANEHITSEASARGQGAPAIWSRLGSPGRHLRRLAPVAAQQRQDILAGKQRRRDTVAAEHAVDQVAF